MLERIITKALCTPWAITPEYGAIVFDVLRSRAQGIRLSDEDIQGRIEAQTGQKAAARATSRTDGVIAVIPIHGVICNRSFEASSGCTSAEYISAAFQRADEDAGVKAIIFDVSSPGGAVDGVPELAKVIRGGTKPSVAFVDALSASAAYWLSSQCDEIVMRESAMVGSVGVYCLTEDWSEYLAKEGVKINAISAGEFKLEGAPWEPLSDAARAHLQAQVDDTYGKFVAAVAAGRGVSVADVRSKYGQGRCLMAAAAKEAGMVDRVGEFDVAVSRANVLAREQQKPASGLAASAGTVSSAAQRADDEPLHKERYMGDPAGQTPVSAGISPNADGSCPDGYEPGADGLCYLVPQDDESDDDAAKAINHRHRLAVARA